MTQACKMIYLARRNPALDAEDFPQAWREHSARGRQCRNVQDRVVGVAQCSRVRGLLVHGASQDYDGVGLLRLRDHAAAEAIWSDPETLAIMRPDEPRVFAGYVRDFTLVAEETVVREVPAGSDIVLYGFLRRRAELSPMDFDASWQASSSRWLEGRLATRASGVVHNRVIVFPPGYAYDSVVEWWFADAAELARACGSRDVRKALPAVAGTLIDPGASVFLATRVTHRRP